MKIIAKILLFMGLHLFTVDANCQWQRIFSLIETGAELHYKRPAGKEKVAPDYFDLYSDSLQSVKFDKNGIYLFSGRGVYSALFKDMKWRKSGFYSDWGLGWICDENPYLFLIEDTLLINGKILSVNNGRTIQEVEKIPEIIIQSKSKDVYGYTLFTTYDSTNNYNNNIVLYKKGSNYLNWNLLDSMYFSDKRVQSAFVYNDSCRYILLKDNNYSGKFIAIFTNDNGAKWVSDTLNIYHSQGIKYRILQVGDTLVFSNNYMTTIGNHKWEKILPDFSNCSHLSHSGKHWWIVNNDWGNNVGYFNSIKSPQIIIPKGMPYFNSINWVTNTGTGYGITSPYELVTSYDETRTQEVFKITNWGMP